MKGREVLEWVKTHTIKSWEDVRYVIRARWGMSFFELLLCATPGINWLVGILADMILRKQGRLEEYKFAKRSFGGEDNV